MSHADDPQVAALQADIERTRAQVADTVDHLQASLASKARTSALGVTGVVLAGIAAVVLVTFLRHRGARQRPFGRRR